MRGNRITGSQKYGLSPAAGQLYGWGLVAAIQTAVITARVPFPESGLWARTLHHLYDIGQLLAAGLLSALAVVAWQRLGASRIRYGRALELVVLWGVATGIAFATTTEDLSGPARRAAEGSSMGMWLAGFVILVAAVIPAAAAAGRLLARPRWRLVAIAGATVAIAAGCVMYPRQYPGLHLFLAWAGAMLAGTALARAPLPAPAAPRARRATLGALGVLGLSTILIWPPNTVVMELLRAPGAVVAPFWARTFSQPDAGRPVTGEGAEWFAPRDEVLPIPPSDEPVIPKDAIVFLFTIDALRADVFQSGAHDDVFPTLARMRSRGTRFTEARTTGSQTVYTLTTLFAGTHFSQQYWSELRNELWPHQEEGVRFPEILAEAGVTTVTYGSAWWLTNRAGVVRGFDEAEYVRSPEDTPFHFTLGRDLVDAAIERVTDAGPGPLFMYMHFMDPHAPYYLGGTDGTPFENHIAEIGYVDGHISRLVDTLEREGLRDRAVFIITSDHGEAFGEHGITEHAVALYDVLLRVPLFVYGAGIDAREVREPVSSIDLGPTLLDLFGESTPGHYMGQSLVPFLQGEDPVLTRPIVAEGRLMQALVARDGIKVIRDLRHNTREAYDLDADPEETRNIIDHPAVDDALNRLRRFFDAHTLTDDGYEVPYRR